MVRFRLLLLPLGLMAMTGTVGRADSDRDPLAGTGTLGESGRVRGTLAPGIGPPPVTLAVIGDFGSRTPAQRVVARMVQSWQPDAVLTVGDNNYLSIDPTDVLDTAPDGRPLTGWQLAVGADYGEFIGRRDDGAYPEQRSPQPRLFPGVGNHDRSEGLSVRDPYKGYYDYFHDNPGGRPRLPADRGATHAEMVSYYVVRLGPVDCFMLDSNPPSESSDAAAAIMTSQRHWLAEQVAASTARWKIACFHHAPYGSGSYGGHARMQWPELARLDALFCGHDHLYERLVYAADGSDRGPPLLITGNGGARLYAFREVAPQSRVRHANTYGAMRLVADESGVGLEAWAVDPETGTRRVLDTVSLGTPPARDVTDDYWFHAPAGLAIEAALVLDPPEPHPATPPELEFWAPDGTRAASGPAPLTHRTTQTGRWRVRLRATTPDPVTYTLALTLADRETFEAWSRRHFTGRRAPSARETADPDRDGIDNLTEFALGTDPATPNRQPPGVTVESTADGLIDIRVTPPPLPAPGVVLRLEERFQPPSGGAVQWLERLVLAPWQPRAGIEAWEEIPAVAGQPAPTLRWQRVQGPAALKQPAFRWKASPLPADEDGSRPVRLPR